MIEKKTWEDFRECKMLWWINMILHTFGWAIIYDYDDDGELTVYPARVKFRGFDEESNSEGYIGLSEYMKSESDKLLEESRM